MKKKESKQSSNLDRKTIEKNRRNHMKNLCFELSSLVPSQQIQTSKEIKSQQDQLDLAASYIKELRERIDKLNERKEEIMKSIKTSDGDGDTLDTMNIGLRLPLVELRDMGSIIEVVLISGLQKNFMLYEVISILQEEGAEVVSASFSTVEDKVFHSVHAQVKISRVGVETSRVRQRLQDLI